MKGVKKPLVIWGSVGIGTILSMVAVLIVIHATTPAPATQSGTVTPSFPTVLPESTSIESLGGWQKLTPPSGDEYYSYTDTLDDISIQVSQQRIPESFKTNLSASVAEMARGYNATNTFKADNLTVYSGDSAAGPQSILFAKDDLLILIKSEAKIQESSWIRYITSLH